MEHVKQSEIPIYVTSLEQSLCDAEGTTYFTYDTNLEYVNEQSVEKLKLCVSSVKSLTAREDLVHVLRYDQNMFPSTI